MNQPNIEPHRITKPIQLLAAWLAGLAVINSSFLLAAAQITNPSWLPAMLAIAAVANVPLFILSLFLLQTKFRPQMQEDAFYSKYLEQTYSKANPQQKSVDVEAEVRGVAARVLSELRSTSKPEAQKIESVLKDAAVENLQARFKSNRTISELYLHRDRFDEIVAAWGDNSTFLEEVSQLISAGLAFTEGTSYETLQLTDVGREVARRIDETGALWNKQNERNLEGTGKKRANQPPQRNAGSRPSSNGSPASETPSSLGPRG